METLYFGKTFDEIFDKYWRTFTRGMEEHSFRHYNNSLGMMVYSKEHLKHEMKKRKMLPSDVCMGLAEEWERKNESKPITKFSPKADRIIREVKLSADRNGNIELGGRAIKALVDIGAIQPAREYMGDVGGFN